MDNTGTTKTKGFIELRLAPREQMIPLEEKARRVIETQLSDPEIRGDILQYLGLPSQEGE